MGRSVHFSRKNANVDRCLASETAKWAHGGLGATVRQRVGLGCSNASGTCWSHRLRMGCSVTPSRRSSAAMSRNVHKPVSLARGELSRPVRRTVVMRLVPASARFCEMQNSGPRTVRIWFAAKPASCQLVLLTVTQRNGHRGRSVHDGVVEEYRGAREQCRHGQRTVAEVAVTSLAFAAAILTCAAASVKA